MVICIQLQNLQRQSGCDLCALISVVLHEKQKKSKHCMQMTTNCIAGMMREQSLALFYSLVLHIQY